MIDVVFLLLVFFMLAARFGQEFALPLSTGGGTSVYDGPPRLITLRGDTLALNGTPLAIGEVIASLDQHASQPDRTIFLQPQDDTSLQDLVDVIDALSAAGFTKLVVVEAPK